MCITLAVVAISQGFIIHVKSNQIVHFKYHGIVLSHTKGK